MEPKKYCNTLIVSVTAIFLGFYNELHNLKSFPKKTSWGVL